MNCRLMEKILNQEIQDFLYFLKCKEMLTYLRNNDSFQR